MKALELSSFSGQSSSYVVYLDGRVLVDNANSEMYTIYNFLAMLKEHTDMERVRFSAICPMTFVPL